MIDPMRECVRCGAPIHWRTPHLCADIERRRARRERQVSIVLGVAPSLSREAAETIVIRLNELGWME